MKLTKKRLAEIGKTYGNLTVREWVTARKVKSSCICGGSKTCEIYDLKRGKTMSCGCRKKEESYRDIHRKGAKKLRDAGILRTGGDNYPKKHRGFKYILKCITLKNRKHTCTLTLENLEEIWNKQSGACAYSGCQLVLPTHSDNNPSDPWLIASLDRIDSSKHYEVDNVQFVSRTINYAKNDMTHEQFLKFLLVLKDIN